MLAYLAGYNRRSDDHVAASAEEPPWLRDRAQRNHHGCVTVRPRLLEPCWNIKKRTLKNIWHLAAPSLHEFGLFYDVRLLAVCGTLSGTLCTGLYGFYMDLVHIHLNPHGEGLTFC